MHADIIRITDAGPAADPSQRYGWTLERDGEPLFRSTEQYEDEGYTREMAAKAVLDGEYRYARFADAPINVPVPAGKIAQTEVLIQRLTAALGIKGLDTEEERAAWTAANAWLG